MKYFATPALLLMLLLSGCHTKPKEFTLAYTMESVGNYKSSIEIGKDKSYLIRQQNIFFDTHAGRERVNTSEGYLTDEEYNHLSELVAGSRLFRMKDTYGFEMKPDPANPFNGFVFQIIYTAGKKTKYISIQSDAADFYSDNFLQLLRFLSDYMSDHFSH